MTPITLDEVLIIAENDCGWRFGVGRLGSAGRCRWIGFATESAQAQDARRAFASEGLPTEPAGLLLFHEVAQGVELGVADRERAILLTGALARDIDSAYGGVDRWLVPPELRGDPEQFRCRSCDRVGCDGRECLDLFGDWDGEDGP